MMRPPSSIRRRRFRSTSLEFPRELGDDVPASGRGRLREGVGKRGLDRLTASGIGHRLDIGRLDPGDLVRTRFTIWLFFRGPRVLWGLVREPKSAASASFATRAVIFSGNRVVILSACAAAASSGSRP
jgi:hypothetical protein